MALTKEAIETAWDEGLNAFDEGDEEGAVLPGLSDPILQWFHSREASVIDEHGKRVPVFTVGWHAEAEINPTVDYVCEQAGFRRVLINHPTSGTDVWHWHINDGSASFFVIAKGLLGFDEMYKPENRIGIAYGWEYNKEQERIAGRQAKFRAVVQELLPYYDEKHPLVPFVVQVRGTIVNDLQTALESHKRVIRAHDMILEAKHRRRMIAEEIAASTPCPKTPWWAFSIPLGPGEKETRKPRNGGGAGFAVSPIVSLVPGTFNPRQDPKSIQEYLGSHHCGILRGYILDKLPETINWSVEESLRWHELLPAEKRGNGGQTSKVSPKQGEPGTKPEDYAGYESPAPTHVEASPAKKSWTEAELSNIPGTARVQQRSALCKLGRADIGTREGLTVDEAGKALQAVQAARQRKS